VLTMCSLASIDFENNRRVRENRAELLLSQNKHFCKLPLCRDESFDGSSAELVAGICVVLAHGQSDELYEVKSLASILPVATTGYRAAMDDQRSFKRPRYHNQPTGSCM
jgi:hypothetical protein